MKLNPDCMRTILKTVTKITSIQKNVLYMGGRLVVNDIMKDQLNC